MMESFRSLKKRKKNLRRRTSKQFHRKLLSFLRFSVLTVEFRYLAHLPAEKYGRTIACSPTSHLAEFAMISRNELAETAIGLAVPVRCG